MRKRGGRGLDWRQRPASDTPYEAVEFCTPAADKWQKTNWIIQVRSSDPDGLSREGKARIWEVYFFSPTPEEKTQFFVIYNRGNVWPNAPIKNKGGEKGKESYQKEKLPDFLVDSPEAYTVAKANGGAEFMHAHPEAKPNATLRCKADYDAIGEEMPAPKYKWIWEVYYREITPGSEVFRVLVDGMNGDFITKETEKPPG